MLKAQQKVCLDRTYNQVLHFCPAANGTFVMLAIRSHLTEVLAHIDRFGAVLKEILFQNADLEHLKMISEVEVLLLYPKDNLILQWNLTNYQLLQVPFMFDLKQSALTNLYVFSETHTFCVMQQSEDQQDDLSLSYFEYPLKSSADSPFMIYQNEMEEQAQNRQLLVRQANNHSMVCWFEPQHDINACVRCFDWRGSPQGCLLECHLKDCEGITGTLFAEMEISISELWEIRPHELLLSCITNEEYDGSKNEYPSFHFVLDTLGPSFRRAKFKLDGKFRNQIVDQQFFGKVGVIRTYDFVEGVSQSSPVYYIDLAAEEIIAQEQWRCSHMSKYEVLPHSPSLMVECLYDNGQVSEVTVCTNEIVTGGLLYTFLLHHLIPGCDEDLINSVVKLTTLE